MNHNFLANFKYKQYYLHSDLITSKSDSSHSIVIILNRIKGFFLKLSINLFSSYIVIYAK